MATKTKDFSIEEKLANLIKVQKIDSKIDFLNIQKGELPLEVKDLEDEVEGLNARLQNINREIEKVTAFIDTRLQNKKDAEALIKKYEKQQENVKNSREFEAISKEIELEGLEIKHSEKNIRDSETELVRRNDTKLQTQNLLEGKSEILSQKKVELDKIILETEKEEKELSKQSDEAKTKVDERLLVAYSRVRKNFRNGLAVVPIVRESCGGCFNMIPPQKQADIAQRKKIIVCEHCGRVLVDNELFEKVDY